MCAHTNFACQKVLSAKFAPRREFCIGSLYGALPHAPPSGLLLRWRNSTMLRQHVELSNNARMHARTHATLVLHARRLIISRGARREFAAALASSAAAVSAATATPAICICRSRRAFATPRQVPRQSTSSAHLVVISVNPMRVALLLLLLPPPPALMLALLQLVCVRAGDRVSSWRRRCESCAAGQQKRAQVVDMKARASDGEKMFVSRVRVHVPMLQQQQQRRQQQQQRRDYNITLRDSNCAKGCAVFISQNSANTAAAARRQQRALPAAAC